MKLDKVQIRNFIGARDVEIEADAPVLVIAGDNGSGKSSTREAIYLAATGEMARIKLKKDYQEAVSDGAKSGQIVVTFGDETASFEIPSGKWGESKTLNDPAMRYCLDPARFAALDETERRRFLFALTGTTLNREELTRRLAQRGIAEDIIAQAIPLTERGMDVAAKECANKARDSKAAWREVTGETYGSTKAETWRAEVPTFDEDAYQTLAARLTAAKAELAETRTEHGRLLGIAEGAQRSRQRAQALREKLAGAPQIEQQRTMVLRESDKARTVLADATAKLNDLVAKKSVSPAPQQQPQKSKPASARQSPDGLLLDAVGALRELIDLADESDGIAGYHQNGAVAQWGEFAFLDVAAKAIISFDARYHDYAPDADVEAADAQPDIEPTDAPSDAELCRARDHLIDCDRISNDLDAKLREIDIDLARMAERQTQLNTLLAEESADVAQDAIDGAAEKVAALETQVEYLDGEIARLRTAREAATHATKRTERAGNLHAAVQAWDACAKALAPDGIPAEIVAEALAPLNAELATIAQQSGWAPVTIDAGMTIRSGGRQYGLLSESEQWRTNACIAAMIAIVSGIRFVMLDRIDVNSIPNRSKLLRWIGTAVRAGKLDGAVLLGTLKAPPTGLPAAIFTTAWLESGKNISPAALSAAA